MPNVLWLPPLLCMTLPPTRSGVSMSIGPLRAFSAATRVNRRGLAALTAMVLVAVSLQLVVARPAPAAQSATVGLSGRVVQLLGRAGVTVPATTSAARAPQAKVTTTVHTANSKTVSRGGRSMTTIYAQPRYRRTSAGWVEATGALTRHRGRFPVRAEDAVVPTWFGTGRDLLRVQTTRGPVSFRLLGARRALPRLTKSNRTGGVNRPGVSGGFGSCL